MGEIRYRNYYTSCYNYITSQVLIETENDSFNCLSKNNMRLKIKIKY